jgi:DNA mismatch endonuclease (patch repair protein)
MADIMTKNERSIRMSRIRSVSTKPEIKLRHALWRLGFRYRTNDKMLPGKPDIVLPRYRSVVFIHGCFWHGHKNCPISHIPETNSEFWTAKIARNQERDQEVWRKLEAKGWSVIIVWECQLKKKNFKETVDRVTGEIVRNGEAHQSAQEERIKARKEYRQEKRERKEREQALLEEVKSL